MASNRKTAIQKRDDSIEGDEVTHRHQPVSNSLKIKLDHLKTFEALTQQQQYDYTKLSGADSTKHETLLKNGPLTSLSISYLHSL